MFAVFFYEVSVLTDKNIAGKIINAAGRTISEHRADQAIKEQIIKIFN